MAFGDFLSGVGDFLGSKGGQSLLGFAGQALKIKELGYRRPNALMPGGGVGVGAPRDIPAELPQTARIPASVSLASPRMNGGGRLAHQNRARDLLMGTQARPAGFPWPDTPFDVFGETDQELLAAAMVAKGCVPWGSDLHRAMALSGQKLYTRSRMVNRGDGTYVKLKCVSTRRPRRNMASPARIREAAKTVRALVARKNVGKKLAQVSAKLLPPKRTPCARKKKC